MMFERFTERARRALFYARYEAFQTGGIRIEAEHLLLALLRDESGFCKIVFARYGVSDASVRTALTSGATRLPEAVEIPFSDATKRALLAAATESDRLHHNYIGTEHLLLGLLVQQENRAAKILADHGLHLEEARTEIASLIDTKE